MNKFILFIFILFPVFVTARAESSRNTIKNIQHLKTVIEKNKEKDIVSELRHFVDSSKSRFVGTANHLKALEYLKKRIIELDPGIASGKSTLNIEEFSPDFDYAKAFYQKDFDDQIKGKFVASDPLYIKWFNFTENTKKFINTLKDIRGSNLVWEKKGVINPSEYIVIGAHYDTIAHDKKTLEITPDVEMPGADDNGSGVAILLRLIATLAPLDLNKSVKVVFFDFEEVAFLGSRSFVHKHLDELKSSNNKGFINLEMLGHDTRPGAKVKKSGDMRIYVRSANDKGHLLDMNLINPMKICADKIVSQVDFKIEANSFNSSDHINFWEKDIPSVTFTQNWEDDFNEARYHTSNDFVETLNLKTFYQSARYVMASLMCWNYDLTSLKK